MNKGKPLLPPMNRPVKPAGTSSVNKTTITSNAAPKAMNKGNKQANGGYGAKPKFVPGIGAKGASAFRDMKF